VPQTAVPILKLSVPTERYTAAELDFAKAFCWALHTCIGRGDLLLAPPARPA